MGERGLELVLDLGDGLVERGTRGDIVAVGVDLDAVHLAGLAAREGVELGDGLDLVAEEGDLPGAVFLVDGPDIQRVALDAECAPTEGGVIALVLQGDQVFRHVAGVAELAGLEGEGHGGVGLDAADTVDAADGGHDDDVVTLQDGAGGRVAHPVDRLVDGALFLDIGVGARHIRFGHVVVVVGDKILHRIPRKKRLKLSV